MDSRIAIQSGVEQGQGFPASEAGGSGVVLIEDKDGSASECFRSW